MWKLPRIDRHLRRSSEKKHRRATSRRALARRLLSCESLEDRKLLTCGAMVCVDVQFVDPASPGVALSELQINEDYEARVFVQDNRGQSASGIFQAYFDVSYNSSLITIPVDEVDHGPQYPIRELGDSSLDGFIDAAGGGSAGVPNPKGDSYLLFSFPFQADAVGTLNLSLAPDNLSTNQVEFFVPGGPVSDIAYVGNSILINEPAGPVVSVETTTAGDESGPINGVFTVNQALATSVDTVVSYSVGGTATAGSDFTALSGSVTIAANTTSATIVVPIVDDDIVDPGESVSITLTGITAGDPEASISGNNNFATFTIGDNDTAGVLVSPTTGLVTSELGGSDSFDVSLTSQPTSNVTIGLTSSNAAEGTISTSSLVFTPVNWNQSQTVTVTGVDDQVDDGDVGYSIVTAAAVSSDPNYSGFDASDAFVTNTDNDAAGITVNPLSGLTTTESGGTQNFSVRLDSQPTADVVIGITSSNPAEGTVSTSSVTFTAGNWDQPQTITITGVDDDIDDGDQDYQIITAAATSSDSVYNNLDAADVSVTNTDDDTRGFIIVPLSGLVTSEAGGSDTFTIRLQSQPTADVSIGLSVSNAQEGSIDKSSVVFTPANWDSPQTVTVTGLDDDVDDDNVLYSIVTADAVSSDLGYAGLDPDDVTVTNTDDDVAGITVAPTSGLVTGENGSTATFDVVLTSEPTSAVTIRLSSSDPSEGTVAVSSLVFDDSNWDLPQTVTVTGVDDDLDDGDITYTIATDAAASADPKYNGLVIADVSVTNTDDDAAGVLVTPTSGLITSEAGDSATFSVQLTARPTGNVTISLVSSDENEGSISVPSITFTPTNWDDPQQLTVTGVDDAIDDGDVAYSIETGVTVSTDATFNGLVVDDVQLTNTDDDTASIIVDPIEGLTTSEAGQSDTFKIVLTSQPIADVTIGLTSSNAGEGTINDSTVTFNSLNWNTPQFLTVTGVDDLVDDGDVIYSIVTAAAVSSDPSYSGMDADDVSVTNTDDDTAGILVQPVAGLQTTEAGGSATFTIVLTSQPVSTVSIAVSSNDTSEGTVDVAGVTFDGGNWNVPQTVTVTGVDDVIDDDDVGFLVVTAPAVSNDANYSGRDAADVSVTNIDDDVPGIAVIPTAGLVTSEAGQSATFDVVLTSQPTASVTIGLSSSNTDEGTLAISSLTFTPNDWDVPQTVTVQGVDDDIVDGSIGYSIVTAPAVSGDSVFAGVDPPDVSVTNQDDDTATLTISSASANEGTGGGQTSFIFDVTLSAAVASSFGVDYSTSDGTAIAADGDYVANSGNLNFAGNQGETRSITVLVNRDTTVEADEVFQVALNSISQISNDLAQRIILPGAPATGTIVNDDTANVTIVGPAPTPEGTSTSDTELSFTVQLSNAVQGGFTLAYDTDDGTATLADGDYTDNDATLTFVGTAGESQTITVAVTADDRIEPDETIEVSLGAISGVPATAADDINVATTPVAATILNDDFPRLQFTEITASNVEGSGGGTTEFLFEVTLSDAVADADGFEVPFTVNDGTATVIGGDYIDNDGTLQFVGTAGETKTISVLVNHDAIVEAGETFEVTLGDLVGLDPSQMVIIPVDTLQSTIENDDVATLKLNADSVTQIEGGAFEITVSLSAEVQGGFTIDHATTDGTATVADNDYTPTSDTLTFAGSINESQTYTVQSTQDTKVELNESLTAALQTLSGLTGIDPAAITIGDPVTLTILNDDSATITISPVAANEGSDGGTTEFAFEVSLSAPVQGGFSIDHQTIDGTAFASTDFVGNSGTLVYSGLSAETQTIRVLVNADQVVEGDEDFQVSLGQITGLLAGLEDDVTVQSSVASGMILNDDTATLSIAGPGTIAEGTGTSETPFVFTVTLSQAVEGGLMVAYNTDDGTATIADGDFQDNDGVLVFSGAAGETRTVTVIVNPDDRVEPDESFTVSLGTISGLPATATDDVTILEGTATAVIQNDDSARLIFSDITSSAVEGSAAQGTTEFRFSVTLTDDVNDPDGFDVPVTINDGTATVAGGDYQDNDIILHFDGTALETQIVTVLVNHDLAVESNETFSVDLGQIVGLAAGESVLLETSTLTATIEDDDSATLTLSTAQLSQSEGDTGTSPFVFDIILSAPVQGGFALSYATNDLTATAANSDYVNNDGVLNFNGTADETIQVTVQIVGDSIVELNESFEFALGSITGLDADVLNRLSISGSPLTATIVNDDTATLTITGPGIQSEGTGGTTTAFDFTVALSNPISSSFDISFQTDGLTATVADNDFVDNDGTLTFAGTTDPQTIRVLVNHDARVEADETFQVSLGQISGLDSELAALLTVETDPVIANIQNDDTASVAFVTDASSVFEADGQHSVIVRLNVSGGGSLTEPVSVNIVPRETGTTTAEDFTLNATNIIFPAGASDGATRTVDIGLVQDNLSESIETLVLGLELSGTNLPAVSLGTLNVHTVTITDDSMDAVLSGRVWVDANNDGVLNLGELTIPAVTIGLTGTTLGGETIDRETTTDSSGLYRFTDLPAGTYSIQQTQPAGFLDGSESLGTVAGVASGSISDDQFVGIGIAPSQVGSGYHFGERGLQASQVSRYRFLSRPRTGGLLGEALTSEMIGTTQTSASTSVAPTAATDGQQSSLTLQNASAEGEQVHPAVTRSGTQLVLAGTSADDRIRITPASGDVSRLNHEVEINGQVTFYDASNIDSIIVGGSEGSDELIVDDTPGNDLLTVQRDRAILDSGNLRIEAIALDLVTAISDSGGFDQVAGDTDAEALDYVLKLEGAWDSL